MSSKAERVRELLALRVQEAMRRANIREEDLALETNIPAPRLRTILAGRCDSTTFFELVAFAIVFGQSVESFLS